MIALKSSLACHSLVLRLGLIVDHDVLGSLPLSVVIDREVKRPSHAGHFQLVLKLVVNLSERVRISWQERNVDLSVPFDTAQRLHAAIHSLWRRRFDRGANRGGRAALGAISAEEFLQVVPHTLACRDIITLVLLVSRRREQVGSGDLDIPL